MIVLVSNQDSYERDIIEAFSIPLHIVRYTTSDEALASLHPEGESKPTPWLILLDATDKQEGKSASRLFREDPFYEGVPILMIIDTPQDRQELLDAGGDDYLFLPLIDSEIRHKIEVHLDPRVFNLGSSFVKKGPERLVGETDYFQALRALSDGFCASNAWLCLYDHDQDELKNVATYNIPGRFLGRSEMANPIRELLERCPSPTPFTPYVIPCPNSFHVQLDVSPEITHLISVPLRKYGDCKGLLILGYSQGLQLSGSEKRLISRIGREFDIALSSDFMHDEVRKFVTRNAFLSFITRLISQESNPQKILSLTLEHTVPLLNASTGEIWLVSNDGQQLQLASSLAHSMTRLRSTQLMNGQGLIGWVSSQGRSLFTESPSCDPRFDAQVDRLEGDAHYSILAVPMHYHEELLGVLAVYDKHGNVFSNLDMIFLESVASLSASGIAHDRLINEIGDFAEQRSVLFEMGQQIVSGLDLHTTLNRALQWISRLIEIEIGLFWLVDEKQDVVNLAASLGMEFGEDEPVGIPLSQGIVGWVGREGECVVINDPQNDPRFCLAISDVLKINPRNLLTLPLRYRGKNLGALSLINKVGGSFQDVEITLLSTAADMIAVAVGNATLYAQTLALMEERERIHKVALQATRLATVGRLTATLSHEINNPMQAIRGALALSMEEMHDERAIADYIDLSLREADRVVQLVHRMQQIYNPPCDGSKPIPVNTILQEAVEIAQKELSRHGITLQIELASNLPDVTGNIDQLHLVFLSLILTLADAIKGVGGNELTIRSLTRSGGVTVEFSSEVPLPEWGDFFGSENPQKLTGMSFGLSFSQDVIVAQGGTIHLIQKDPKSVVAIDLPLPCYDE